MPSLVLMCDICLLDLVAFISDRGISAMYCTERSVPCVNAATNLNDLISVLFLLDSVPSGVLHVSYFVQSVILSDGLFAFVCCIKRRL